MLETAEPFLIALTIFVLSVATEHYPADKTGLEPSRDSIIRIVTQIQRADYEGDRPGQEKTCNSRDQSTARHCEKKASDWAKQFSD